MLQEMHVTVENPDIPKFKESCSRLQVKPIILDLDVMTDVMTSSTMDGTDDELLAEAQRISSELTSDGHKVVRVKIESSPFRDDVPQLLQKPDKTYFESHLQVKLQPQDLSKLRDLGIKYSFHVSRNPFKKKEDHLVVMATIRDYRMGLKAFESHVADIKQLIEAHWVVDKTIIEWAWYDTNVEHDKTWVNQLS